MMRQFLGFTLLLVATIGCGSTRIEKPPSIPSPVKTLGLLEVTLDFSDELNPTSRSNFKPFVSSKLQTQSLTANGNTTSQIAIKRNSVGFIDANETFGTKTRYVRATFDIANFSATSFKNLNFVATSLNTQLGTMFSSLKDGADVVIPATDTVPTGELTYRAIKPTHGMRSSISNGVEIEPEAADMQLYSEAETDVVQVALNTTYPALQVLEYGYTARSVPTSGTARTIGMTPTSANCSSTLTSPPNGYTFVTNNSSCFKGRVTFAFKLPRKPIRSQNPFTFSFVFVVADDIASATSQSQEEQSIAAQTSLEQVLNLNVLPGIGGKRYIRTLPSSGIFGYPNPTGTGVQRDLLCRVETATVTPTLAQDFFSNQPGVTSVLPIPNSMFVAANTVVQANTCDLMFDATSSNFVINSAETGRRSSSNGDYSTPFPGDGLVYTPTTNFRRGEEVEVSLTQFLTRTLDNAALKPIVYRFRIASSPEAVTGFNSKVSTATVGTPIGLTTGDFNSDGHLDVVVTNPGGNQVNALLNTGGGGFSAPLNSSTGANPGALTTGDFNADGNLDIAVVNQNPNTISLLLGNGLGLFPNKTDYAVGAGAVAISNGDLNGDGALDLVVVNNSANTISLLLGNAFGVFTAKTDYLVGTSPRDVTLGDFNGDGKLDVAVANSSADTISLLLGTGIGTFDTKTDFPVGSSPKGLAAGDFNTDGKLDLAVVNQGSSTISLLLGTGYGSLNPKTDFIAGTNPIDIKIGDFNGDNKLDVITANFSSVTGSASVLLGTGTGSFAAKTDYSPSENARVVSTGDVNADGKLDFITGNSSSNSISVLLKK